MSLIIPTPKVLKTSTVLKTTAVKESAAVANDFDFLALKARFAEPQALKPKPLMMLITGKRAQGKSFCLGSCDGDALLFASRQEHHSYSAAIAGKLHFGNKHSITPMWIDIDDNGELIDTPERVIDRLNDKLEALIRLDNLAEIFPYVFFDSLNAIERYTIRQDNVEKSTQFQKSVVATANLIKLIIDKLLRLHEKGCNIIVTMASEVKEKVDGSGDLSLTPMLTGYRTAEEVIGSFPDIALMNTIPSDVEGQEPEFVFQFRHVEGSKSGKKFSGEITTSSFNPRLQCLPKYKLPVYIKASFTELQKFIRVTFNSMAKGANQ